jgi:hypothetical protein
LTEEKPKGLQKIIDKERRNPMKQLIVCCILILALLVASGCAGIRTYPARPHEARGIRVYPQKIYLLVSEKESKFVSLPDAKNGYDIKPWSFLSKHDFNIKIEEAQVKELDSKQDSSAALSLLQKVVEVAGKVAEKAAEAGAGAAVMAAGPGSRAMAVVKNDSIYGFKPGIYELTETGEFKKVSPSF